MSRGAAIALHGDDAGHSVGAADTRLGSAEVVRRMATIEVWLRRGAIELEEYRAGERFAADYEASRLAPRYSSQRFERVDCPPRDASAEAMDRSTRAYWAVQGALRAVGARAAPALIAIVALHEPMPRGGVQAAATRGTVTGALSALVAHYGDAATQRAA